MANKTSPLLPDVTLLLAGVGENIRLARLRRHLSVYQVSERAGMSLPTLRAVERGQAGVTIGAYASVLRVLGLEKDLAVIAATDMIWVFNDQVETSTPITAPKNRSLVMR